MTNHIALLLDRSASMQPLAKEVIAQYNSQAKHIQEKAEQTGQKTLLSLYTFSDKADQPVLVECPLDLVTLRPLDGKTYQPDGWTAMLDSVGLAVEQLSQFERGRDDSFLIICITDGEENASTKYKTKGSFGGRDGWDSMAALIKQKTGTDAWTFVFLVPKGKKQQLLNRLHVYDGNVLEWEQTDAGVREYNRVTTQGLDNYFSMRSQGLRSSKGFFQTDLSNVSRGDVCKTLRPVTDMFTRIRVDKKVQVEPFCRYHTGGYTLGHAYYELTKQEKVQPQKKVLVEDRKTGTIYGGPEARHLIGLPDGLEVKVKPGDHGNYRIYVQSTSVNRNLMPDTDLLYYKGTGVSV